MLFGNFSPEDIKKKKKMKTLNSKRYIHPNVHNSIIYDSQNMGAT